MWLTECTIKRTQESMQAHPCIKKRHGAGTYCFIARYVAACQLLQNSLSWHRQSGNVGDWSLWHLSQRGQTRNRVVPVIIEIAVLVDQNLEIRKVVFAFLRAFKVKNPFGGYFCQLIPVFWHVYILVGRCTYYFSVGFRMFRTCFDTSDLPLFHIVA